MTVKATCANGRSAIRLERVQLLRPATPEGVYCVEHARVAYQPAKKRERRAREFDYIQRLAG